MMRKAVFHCTFWAFCFIPGIKADVISLEQFIRTSCMKDIAFQEILVDELRLQYKEALALPAQDWVLSVIGEYGLTFDGESSPKMTLSLERLFPLKGSALRLDLGTSRLKSGGGQTNDLSLVYSVDLARNAFGRANAMLKDIVGIESRIARVQILGAYETYLASLIRAYYDWARAYEEVTAAQASVEETRKLLENIKSKKTRHIAYQVDVDKAKLQLINKEERLRSTLAAFQTGSIRIAYSMGIALNAQHIPDTSRVYLNMPAHAENLLDEALFDSTRSGRIYGQLYVRDSLNIASAAQNLLPSLSAYGGIGLSDENDQWADNAEATAGLRFSLPFKKPHEKAERELARIDQQKTALGNSALRGSFSMRIAQLRTSIKSQKQAVSLAEQRAALAESIHKAEAEDYLYGRTNLNDLIQALNTLQSNRLLAINSRIDLAQKQLEALDLLDALVTETEIDSLR